MPQQVNVLNHKKIAILATDGFDESQLFSPKQALEAAGAEVVIVSLNKGQIKAWEKDHWGKSIEVDTTVNECNTDEFDGLVIPGSETPLIDLSRNKSVGEFVKKFYNAGKSIAAICHGTKVLIDSGMIKGKLLTTWPAMKNEVIKCGGKWKDDEVVTHKGIITSRCPSDNPGFNKMMIESFAISPRNTHS